MNIDPTEKRDVRVWVAATQRKKTVVLAGLRGPSCKNPDQWGLFGGHVDEAERSSDAACRELEEETGLQVTPQELSLFASVQQPRRQMTVSGTLVPHRYVAIFQVPVRKLELSELKFTQEVVDYEFADVSWLNDPTRKLHYSLRLYLELLAQDA